MLAAHLQTVGFDMTKLAAEKLHKKAQLKMFRLLSCTTASLLMSLLHMRWGRLESLFMVVTILMVASLLLTLLEDLSARDTL